MKVIFIFLNLILDNDYDKALNSYNYIYNYIEDYFASKKLNYFSTRKDHIDLDRFINEECNNNLFILDLSYDDCDTNLNEVLFIIIKCVIHLIIHCYQNLKNYELASQFCEKLLKIDDNDINCIMKKGLSQFMIKNNSIEFKRDIEISLKLSVIEEQRKLIYHILKSIS